MLDLFMEEEDRRAVEESIRLNMAMQLKLGQKVSEKLHDALNFNTSINPNERGDFDKFRLESRQGDYSSESSIQSLNSEEFLEFDINNELGAQMIIEKKEI